MAKKAGAAVAASSAIERTFQLAVPIRGDDGKEWSALTLQEPLLRHRVEAQRRKSATETERTIVILSALSGASEAALRRMKSRDARKVSAWLDSLQVSARQADDLADAAEQNDVVSGSALPLERTFQLLVPIDVPGAPVTSVTVREPDLEAGIAVERMQSPGEQTAALIASCAGLVIPVVMRMSLRDVARLERWFDFFFDAGIDMPAETAETLPASTDGVTWPSA